MPDRVCLGEALLEGNMTLFKVRLTASSDRSTMNLRFVYNAGDFSILYEEEI